MSRYYGDDGGGGGGDYTIIKPAPRADFFVTPNETNDNRVGYQMIQKNI